MRLETRRIPRWTRSKADYVIHVDPWWNPAVEAQASDRAHRIGQTRPVTVYRLIASGTIEERIVELYQKKRELATSLLDESHTSAALSPCGTCSRRSKRPHQGHASGGAAGQAFEVHFG